MVGNQRQYQTMKTHYPSSRYSLKFHRYLCCFLIVIYILLCAAFLILTLLGYEKTTDDSLWRYVTYPITSLGILAGLAAIVANLYNSRRILWLYLYYNNGISLTYLLVYFVVRIIWGTLPNFPLSISIIGCFLIFTVVQDYYMLAYFRLLDFQRVFLFYAKQTDINKYIDHGNGSITSDTGSSFVTTPYSFTKDSVTHRNSMNSNEDLEHRNYEEEEYTYDTPRDPNEESNYAIFQEGGNKYGKKSTKKHEVTDNYILEGVYVPVESLKPIMNDLNQHPTMTDLSQMTVYIDGSAFNFMTFCYLEEKFAPILKLRRNVQNKRGRPKSPGPGDGKETRQDQIVDGDKINIANSGQSSTNHVSQNSTNSDHLKVPISVKSKKRDSDHTDLKEQLIPQGYKNSPRDDYISSSHHDQ